MDYNAFREAWDMAPIVPRNVTAVDTSLAAIVQYVPDLGTGGAAATCTVAVTGFTFTVDAAVPANEDAIGSVAGGIVLWSTATMANGTWGGMADYVNSKGAWRMILRGALRADAHNGTATAGQVAPLTAGSASCIGDNGLRIYFDTSVSLVFSEAISGERFVNNGIGGHLKDADDRCINHLLYAGITVSFPAGTALVSFWTESQTATGVQIGSTSATLTTATKREYGYTSGAASNPAVAVPYVSSRPGERLVIRVTSTSITMSAPAINLVGKTQVLSGEHIVTTYDT